jgi:hypothetical protein
MASNPFVGTWRLISWEDETEAGEKRCPFGPNPKGYIIYSADGYMSVVLCWAHRARFAGDDPFGGTPEEKVSAYDSYVSYCGRYEVQEDRVIHKVELSKFPNWYGNDQVRFYRFDGNRLILTTPLMLNDGQKRVSRLIWERV